jgi:hypothetical protein
MQPSGREMQGGGGAQDDFFDQMLSTLPAAWSDLGSGKSPWELPAAAGAVTEDAAALDEPALLASRLRHHQIGGGEKPLMLHLSDLHGLGAGAGAGDDAGFMPLPLFTQHLARDDVDAAFKSPNAAVRSLCSGTCSRLQNSLSVARAPLTWPSFGPGLCREATGSCTTGSEPLGICTPPPCISRRRSGR